MSSTRTALLEVTTNVDESMGVRETESKPRLSPVASSKDAGRKPLRKFGAVQLDRIMPDPDQPRTAFDEESIQRLASSIRNNGQLNPIRVRWDESYDKWIIVTGERRFRATQAAGLSEIDCYFHDDDLTESEILEEQLVENLLRQDLSPLEEGRGYAALMELNDWNGKQVAESLRVSPSKVSRALALLDLPDAIQQKIESGALSRAAAYELCKLENESVQKDLAQVAVEQNFTKQEASNAVRQRAGKRTKASRRKSSKRKDSVKQLSFSCPHGIEIVVRVPEGRNYHHVLEAKDDFAQEIQLRADNNISIF